MNLREILKTIIYLVFALLVIFILIYFAFQSEFASISSKNSGSDDSGYKMKTKYYKEFYYPTKFKKDKNNENILSLGRFAINMRDSKHSKLIIKVTVKTQKKEIDEMMNNQAVIRDDVINSLRNLRLSDTNQNYISTKIKNTLNNRFKNDKIEEVYIEEFLVQ